MRVLLIAAVVGVTGVVGIGMATGSGGRGPASRTNTGLDLRAETCHPGGVRTDVGLAQRLTASGISCVNARQFVGDQFLTRRVMDKVSRSRSGGIAEVGRLDCAWLERGQAGGYPVTCSGAGDLVHFVVRPSD